MKNLNPVLSKLPKVQNELTGLPLCFGREFFMKEIKLTHEQVSIIDDDDFERINQFKWFADKIHNDYYAKTGFWINGKNKHYYMHHFILNCEHPFEIDHINHNPLDNRKENLRVVTHHQNTMNSQSRKGSSSKYKGVCWDKSRLKWTCNININGKLKFIGRYKSEMDAAKAYNLFAIKYFKEFSNLNTFNN